MNSLDATRLAGIVPRTKTTRNYVIQPSGTEWYVFLYEDGRELDAMRIAWQFVSDSSLNFTFYDAAVVSIAVKHKADEKCKGL